MKKKNINNPTSTGEVGRQAAKALFEGPDATYNLQEFHDTFIKLEDTSEYLPALQLVGTWTEWERLKRDWKGFATYIQSWKEELEVKLKSRSMQQIIKLAKDGNYQASKWVAEEGFNKRSGAGRPSASERKRAAKELSSEAADTIQDRERVLRLINGSK